MLLTIRKKQANHVNCVVCDRQKEKLKSKDKMQFTLFNSLIGLVWAFWLRSNFTMRHRFDFGTEKKTWLNEIETEVWLRHFHSKFH